MSEEKKAPKKAAKKTAEKAVKKAEKSTEQTDAPRELFSKMLGDKTPEVIEWRRENWPKDRFKEKYGESI